jgi:selenide,water dikinase
VRPDEGTSRLVLTIDVITPIVDDPRAFGGIAAANALSDVYAMGGRPQVALGFVGLPTDKLPLDVLREVLLGMNEACARAGCAIVGGHTIADAEPKCGLAVVGTVDPSRIWSQRSARQGDALVLTKAIGTGLVGQAIRAGTAAPEVVSRATAQMLALNDVARDVGVAVDASSCTDVTGFGLLGHVRNLVEAAGLSAELVASSVPLLPGALDLARAGVVPGGTKRNLNYASPVTAFDDAIEPALRVALADAQTSGGLLLCVPPARADEALAALRARGVGDGAVIGRLGPGPARVSVLP